MIISLEFTAFRIIGNTLNHPVRYGRHHSGVHSVVQVSVGPVFAQPQPLAHIVRHSAVDCPDRLFRKGRVLRKFQMVIQQIVDRSGDVLGIGQVPLLESFQILFRQLFFQQPLPLAVVPDTGLHQSDEPLRFLRVSTHILQREPVALLPVLRGQHKDLVPVAVVKAETVRHNVVYIHIARFKQP